MNNAIEKACKGVGSQAELARLVGVKPQAIVRWLRNGVVPARRVLAVVQVTGGAVTPHELNPDIFAPTENESAV